MRPNAWVRPESAAEARFEQRSFGNAHVDQVIEPVIEQDLRIEDHDHVDAEEHLEHVFVEVEIDRGRVCGSVPSKSSTTVSPSRHIVQRMR
jgi:hypothetical protein